MSPFERLEAFVARWLPWSLLLPVLAFAVIALGGMALLDYLMPIPGAR
jgi:hypothetical protein